MIVRALDVDGDWTFGRGKNNYLRDADAVGQSIKTRLLSFLGDCFFNLEAGIDWFNLLGTKNTQGLSLAIRTTILNTRDVTSLLELSASLNENREQTVNYSVSTVYSVNQPLTDSVEVPL